MARVIIATIGLSFLLIQLSLPCYGKDLSHTVEKYRNITVTQDQLNKLKRYQNFIHYFSSFSYFKPRHKVSVEFVKALILAESGCNPYAVSPKNAIGLGQILFSTGKQAAKELYETGRYYRYIDREKLKNLQKADLFDPAINILITCYLIAKYNFRFDGKLDLVVSAWNAGENLEILKYKQPAPYSETHNLIGKVNGYFLFLLKHRR